MSDVGEKKGFKWLEKLKKIKHIEIYIAIIFITIILLIYLSSNKKSNSSASKNLSTTKDMSVTEYINDLEDNLEVILSNIGGVSNVKVMITLKMSQAEVIDSKISITKFPDIQGVLITAKGLNNTSTKLKVLRAVEAVLSITNSNIEILSSD